ncbi:MAG: mechanosensitive ion channel family protein [Rhodospirillaceae bacterium]|jgi:small conductance mechanosensitive channel|nr:mechanosensitive ion channel family protein [Rhodospirillaceae bacterium]MBT4220652.1 mechanosensitive ion channel family protein [Rhodospirillaceae bacterium]MBT4463867.1 mechanosensitive ion channel family protein [Rhodospirillaceae bacterium]MBT5014611.1 mechanosensitive ion channel family protein [Rhodospirillaceae bacterium]MBT5308632.1 mechanosensitive ion channel family protein [Rhodospirillaceae bacterium]
MDKQVEDVVVQQVETVSRWVDTLIEFGITYGFQILGALFFLFVGLKAAGWAGRKVSGLLEGKNIDPTLGRFIGNVIKVVLIIFLVIITLGNFGISTAPLIALAGAGAFGATIAIQGPLSNYGAGLSIILTQPFSVGNTITVNKVISGVVDDITLAHTILIGEDGEKITIPNKEIVGKIIVNSEQNRVVQTKICIGEDEDAEKVMGILRDTLRTIDDINGGPKIQVGIHDFTYGGIVLGIRFWVPSSRYFQVRYAVNGAALAALKFSGVKLISAGAMAVPVSSLSADEEEEETVL